MVWAGLGWGVWEKASNWVVKLWGRRVCNGSRRRGWRPMGIHTYTIYPLFHKIRFMNESS